MSWVRRYAPLPVAIGRRVVAAAAMLLASCSGTKVSGVLARAPNGVQVLSRDKATLSLFDLPSGKAVWQAALPAWDEYHKYYAVFSANGRYFVLGEEQELPSTRRLYSVWESATGRRVSAQYDHSAGTLDYPAGLDVSDDGRWLASGRAKNDGTLQLIDVSTNKVVLETALQGWGALRPTHFAPDSKLLAARHEIFRLENGVWRSVANVPDALDNVWVGSRLAIATLGGVDIWDAGRVTQHIDYPFKISHTTRSDPESNLYMAATEHWLALCERETDDPFLTLYDVDRGAKLLERRGLGTLGAPTFRGETAFWLSFRDFDTSVVVFDVRSNKIIREIQYGAYGAGRYAASPSAVYFTPHLLPGGRYFELEDPDQRWSRFKPIEY